MVYVDIFSKWMDRQSFYDEDAHECNMDMKQHINITVGLTIGNKVG